MRKAIYSVEGNIGSGKSTLLSLIKEQIPAIQVVPEPVADWQNVSKFNLLEIYYKDPHRWAYTFQLNAVATRMKGLRDLLSMMKQQPDNTFFSERSIIADKQIFAKMLYQQGKMSQMQHELYLKMFSSLDELFETPRSHKYIYLRTSPQKCMERVRKRKRFEEEEIPVQYLKQIHNLHEGWLRDGRNSLIVEGDEEFQQNEARSKEIIERIKKFIRE